jgi:hypothetical protein
MSIRPAGLDFHVRVCRFVLAPRAHLRFGRGGAANDFRGALGFRLPEAFFRPRSEQGPSGLRDLPRPFVLRTRPLEGRSIAPGENFELRLHLFDPRASDLTAAAVREACVRGIGPARIPLSLVEFALEDFTFDLKCREAAPDGLLVRFLTPVELKGWIGVPPLPFDVLAARLRDRISALRAAYGPGPADFDFRGLAERARAVECVSCRLEQVAAERTSRRTGRRHPLGGAVGECVYRGDLREFVPLLEAGVYTGVGRQTVWGKGEFEIRDAG